MTNRVFIVDVFAERPLQGNPLAVVVVDTPMSQALMQRFAAEMNFSETTFVFPRAADDGGYDVRIFTPVREIAFAGHPVLGTAWVVRHHLSATPLGEVRLNLVVGQLVVTFSSGATVEEAWFAAPPMVLGPTAERSAVAAAVGLSVEEIATDAPVQLVSAGTSAMIVPVEGLEALGRSGLDLNAFAGLAASGFPPLVYLFCRETRNPRNDFSARFFFEADGVREDPATGNGAAFLGAYLLRYRGISGRAVTLRIEQGEKVGRPSLVLLRACDEEGVAVSVGGGVIPIVQGMLL